MSREKIAVIGGGVAGIVAAYLLDRKHDVTIFEAEDYLGGHTSTIVLEDGPDEGVAVDTGFIVSNNHTYPNYHKFIKSLGVDWRWSDMSFAYYSDQSGFNYAGTTLNGLFSQRSNLINPRFWSFMFEILKFSKLASEALEGGSLGDKTLQEFADENNLSEFVISNYVIPMSGAIWSASQKEIRDFPVSSLFSFFRNHGLLSVLNRPRWQTVVGGSFSYVKAFKKKFSGQIRLSSKVSSIRRVEDGVCVELGDEQQKFDKVVVALHADLAHKVLESPSSIEGELLSAWTYQNNETVLHYDTSFMPPNRRAWASWNYLSKAGETEHDSVRVTYWMNLLQGLKTEREYLVSLNQTEDIDPSKIVRKFNYTHPTYTTSAVNTQPRLQELNAQGDIFYCGSYFGYGFHEDAVKAGLAVAKCFGEEL